MSFFKNIMYFMLSVQERILRRNLMATIGAKKTSKSKKYYGQGFLVSLDAVADAEKLKMEEELSLILKSANYNPTEVLEYIKKHGTSVFYIENPKQLYAIGENEGFLYPQKGLKALYLALLVEKSFKLKTDEMFVLSKGEINKYYFLYHFYNWYAFKHGVIGLDADSQALLKNFLFSANDDDFKKLQLKDIYKLKDAISQDKSAIEFVLKLCREYDGSKKALDKVKDGGANI